MGEITCGLLSFFCCGLGSKYKMKKIITNNTPKELIELYVNDPYFHSLVTHTEIIDGDYIKMLEEAVVTFANMENRSKSMVLKYAQRFGIIDEE